MEKKLGKVYNFCSDCPNCPVAVEAEIEGKSGLTIKDDFGGTVKLNDQNLKDLKNFLESRFKN